MEQLKFKEVEKRFLKQFNMPPDEKLVNCEELFGAIPHPYIPSLCIYYNMSLLTDPIHTSLYVSFNPFFCYTCHVFVSQNESHRFMRNWYIHSLLPHSSYSSSPSSSPPSSSSFPLLLLLLLFPLSLQTTRVATGKALSQGRAGCT